MKSKEQVLRRIEAIKNMNDPLEAIQELSDLTYDIGNEACKEREEIRKLTEANRAALLGNGKHEESVIYRLGETVKTQSKMMETLMDIQKALVGDINDPKNTSILGRLRDVERVIDNINKITWIIIGVFVTQVALFVWAFFIH